VRPSRLVKALERRGFIAREPGKVRSILLLIPTAAVPELERA
jgi:hypothetical protein